MPVLEINNLVKKYGSITAIDGLNLTIERGNVYGILGPNGSGKTTTLGIVLNILKQNQGEYTWFENKYGDQTRRHIGALLETPNFYPYLNAIDNLALVAHIKKSQNDDFDQILRLVNLHERKHSKFRTYSLGMKQRLAIASTLVGDPEVLIYDEPTNGLDPQGIAEVRESILHIASTGKTIIMASHILDEVEKICTHVTILRRGKLLATGTVGSIINNEITVELASVDMDKLQLFIQKKFQSAVIKQKNGYLEFTVDPDIDISNINQLAFDEGIVLNHLVQRKRKLEEEFLEITKEN